MPTQDSWKCQEKCMDKQYPLIALFPQSGESVVGMLWVSLSCEHFLSQLPPFCFMETAVSEQLPVYFYYQYSPEVISKLTLNCLRASCDLNIWESYRHNTVKGKTFNIHWIWHEWQNSDPGNRHTCWVGNEYVYVYMCISGRYEFIHIICVYVSVQTYEKFL